MGRNYFLNKLSFAVFLCAAVFIYIGSSAQTFKNFDTTHWISAMKPDKFLDKYYEYKVVALRTIDPSAILPIYETHIKKAIPTNDLQCMAENIYYEAGNQSYAGKIAVGQVVLNRKNSQGYPGTICGVIYEGSANTQTHSCQFSWTCMDHKGIAKSSSEWSESLTAAKELLSSKDKVIDITEGATNYHADYVNPDWSKRLRQVTKIDQHIFYKTM